MGTIAKFGRGVRRKNGAGSRRGSRASKSFAHRARAVATSDAGSAQGPLGERALRTRDQIVSAAVELFVDKGYGGTTIDEIADAAGISRPTFYTYFPSKREILLLAGVRSSRAREEAIAAISEIPGKWRLGQLEAWIRRYFAFLDEYSAYQLVWSQASWHDDELKALGIKGSMQLAEVVGKNMVRLGCPTDGDPGIDGLAVISMLDRFWYFWRKTKAPYTEAAVVGRLAAILAALLRR